MWVSYRDHYHCSASPEWYLYPYSTALREFETMIQQGILETVQRGLVTNASPVVLPQQNGSLRLIVNLKIIINGKVLDEV